MGFFKNTGSEASRSFRLALFFRISSFFLGVGFFLGIALALWIVAAKPSTSRDRPIATFNVPSEGFRIVAFGTSLTRANPWPDDLAHELSACFGQRVEVLRVARSGAGSVWGLSAVDQVLAAHPDLVLMEFAINDADILDGVSLRRSYEQHAALIEQLQTVVPPDRIVLMTMNPVGGLQLILRVFLPRYYAQQVTLADQYGTALADLYADWLALPAAQRQFPDGLHPEAQDTARTVVPALTKRIAHAAGRTCLET